MKNKKNILATVFALILALSVVTASATAAAENGRRSDKIETLPEIISAESPDDCGVPSVESFVRNLDTLTEKERAALIADLDELARLEKQIDEIYARITDGNADKLYDEIDAVNDKITAVLERNAELWERVNDEYDEQVAANETDMTLELNEADLNDLCEEDYSYESFVKNLGTLTEKERAALIADLDELAKLEKQIDAVYDRMTDENADKLYGEIDKIEAEITKVLDRNAGLWERVSDAYDEQIAAHDPVMAF